MDFRVPRSLLTPPSVPGSHYRVYWNPKLPPESYGNRLGSSQTVERTNKILVQDKLCCMVQNVTHGTDNLRANFRAAAAFLCRVMGKHASERRHDLITLTFDLSTSKWVTGHSCYGLYSCRFSPCYILPFLTC